MQSNAVGGCAWILLGVLAIVVIAALWEHWGRAELEIGLLLAVSVPVLVANRFAADFSAASATRWALAICFVVCSAAVWGRKWLKMLCEKLHVKLDMPQEGPRTARGVLVILSALPVILLTLAAAMIQLAGYKLNDPLANTFFDNISPTLSYLVPLALIIIGLVGYALRESSAGYAFGAGLVAEMTVILGYALHLTLATPPQPFRMAELVTTIQLAVITAAAWALIWIIARRWVNVWREGEGKKETILMNVQLGMAILGNAILIGIAVFDIFIIDIYLAYNSQPEWAMHAGLPLGWCAFAVDGRDRSISPVPVQTTLGAALCRTDWHGRFGLIGMCNSEYCLARRYNIETASGRIEC